MQVKYLVLFIILLLSSSSAHAQITFTYDPISCGVPTTNVMASASCTDTLIDAGIDADDVYSDPVPIGFTFNFYGTPYTSLVIGANGNISFSTALAGTYNPWSIVGSLATSTIRNSICGPWCDMDFPENGGSCTYKRTGTAPNRRFIVNYCRVSMYNVPYCANEWTTSQIILYENSNLIDVHITHKSICNAWNNGRAICGLINSTGSSSIVAPSRDWFSNWNANNESWRFTPVGAGNYSLSSIPFSSSSCGTSMYWYDNVTGIYLGTGSMMTIATNVPRQLKIAVFSNCKDSSFYYFNVPVPTVMPNPKEIHGPDTLCVGSSAVFTDSTHGGFWSFPSLLTGSMTPTGGLSVTAISDGVGFIFYTLPTGCRTSKVIYVNPTPSPILPDPIVVCRGHTDTLTNLVSDGFWSSSNTSVAIVDPSLGIITGITPGTTTIKYTRLGCSASAPATVNQQPAAIVPPNPTVCQGNTVLFTNSVSGGIWSSTNTSVATIGSTSGLALANTPGTATISYTLPAGCFSTTEISVNATPGAITPATATICMGTTFVLSASDLGGSWVSGNTAIATVGLGSGIVTPVAPGNTLISYVFPNGCYRTVPITVEVSPTDITPAATQLCIGNGIALSTTPSGGTWSTSNIAVADVNPATGSVSGVSAGTAIITYATSATCYKTAMVTVTPLPPDITPSPASACIGGTLVMSNATSGGTWSSSNLAVATIGSGSGIVNPSATGTAVISYILPGVCYRTTIITVNPQPAAILPATIELCAGTTITVTNASGAGTWSSSTPSIATIDAASGVLSGIAAGFISITYTLPTGCYTTAPVTVNAAPAPISPADGMLCPGGALLLSNSSLGGTWSSANTSVATVGSSSGIVAAVSPGTAIISYILPGVCFATDTITVNPLPDPIDPSSMNICQGGVHTLTSLPSGGTWSSSNPSIVFVDASSGFITGTASGTATITYTLGTTCYRTASINVEPASPIVPGDAVICTGRSVTFTNTGAGGTWSISDPAIASIGSGTLTVSATGLAPGTAVLTYSFPGGCQRIANITVNASPADITGKLTVCAKDTTRLADTTIGGNWSSNALSYATISATGLVTGVSGGTATISYKITNGCFATAVVTVFALPDAGTITGSDSICIGSAITKLTNSPGTPGFWFTLNTGTASIDSATGIVSGWSSGNAIITYHTQPDANGCSDYTTFPLHIFSNAPFTIEETIIRAKCYGDGNGIIAVNIKNGSGNYAYFWQDSSNAQVLTSLTPGTYSVMVTDTKTRCAKIGTFVLTQPDSLDIIPLASPDICSKGVGSATAEVSGGTAPYRFTWSNDSTGQELTGLYAGNYEVTVKDDNGCNKRLTVPVRDSSGRIHIHNALSPNNDGFNDVWLIDLIEDNPFNEVQVLNKWGNVIWERTGYRNDWEGVAMNGDKLPDGTYFYIVRLNNPDPKCAEGLYKGALLIKR